MVAEALKARELLLADGIDAGVLNMSTIKPLDAEAVIVAARRCGAIVTAEEHSIIGGLGSAVAEVLAESAPTPMVRIGIRDQFGTSGDPDVLLAHYRLSAMDIRQGVKEVIERKKQ
jgi:transketolase